MPIKVVLDKSGFVIDEFIFYEEDKEIEIRVKKNEYFLKELIIKLLNDSGAVMVNQILVYAGEDYHTDKRESPEFLKRDLFLKISLSKVITLIKSTLQKRNKHMY